MSRWQIDTNGDYYTRYRNYENYLRANAGKLNLTPEQVQEQLGRYAEGLQHKLQYEPQNKTFGKEVAKNPTAWGITNPNQVSEQLAYAESQLSQLQADLGNTTGQVSFEDELKKSQLYKSTNGNSVDKLGKRKQNQIADEIKKLAKLAKTPEEKRMLEERIAKFRGGNDKALFNNVLNENIKVTSAEPQSAGQTPKNWKQYYEARGLEYKAPEKFGGIEADRKAQEIIARNEQRKFSIPETETRRPVSIGSYADDAPRTVTNFADDADDFTRYTTNFADETDDAARSALNFTDEAANAAENPNPVKKRKGLRLKARTRLLGSKWNKLPTKGKAGLIIAGAALVVGTGVALFGGGKDEEKVNENVTANNPPQNKTNITPAEPEKEAADTIPADTIATDEPVKDDAVKNHQPVVNPQPVENPDSAVTQPAEQQPVVTAPAAEAETEEEQEPASEDQQEAETHQYIVQKGDHFWGLAKKELIKAHKDDPDYKPTNREILELAKKIMKENGYELDENNYYPTPMLYPGDKLNLAA